MSRHAEQLREDDNVRRLYEADAPAAVQRLRDDMDLGLRMVEGLVRIGEHGAAARLVEELRTEAHRTLDRPRRTAAAATRVRRSAVMAGTVAAALGIGLSAAALVAGPVLDPAPERRQPARMEAPAGGDLVRPPVHGERPLPSDTGSVAGATPGRVPVTQAPAGTTDPTTEPPALHPPLEPSPPAVEPPGTIPPVLGSGLTPPASVTPETGR